MPLQALRVPRVTKLTSIRRNAGGSASPALSTALAPVRNSSATAGRASGRRRRRTGGRGRHRLAGSRRRSRGTGRRRTGFHKRVHDALVGRFLDEVGIPGQGSTLTREDGDYPGILVDVIPDGDTNALLGLHASGDGVLVVDTLLGEQSSGRRESHADVKLGDGNLDALSNESGHVGSLSSGAGGLGNNEVGLETDTVNLGATSLDHLDDVMSSGGLGTSALDVVVFVV